jgi:hypothetical protein
MNLHDQYHALLRRGMPEHSRQLQHLSGEDWYWPALGNPSNVEVVAEADAADIITMHALRWWLLDTNAMSFSIRSNHWGGGFPPCAVTGLDGSVLHAPTILEAIVAATLHLEPA